MRGGWQGERYSTAYCTMLCCTLLYRSSSFSCSFPPLPILPPPCTLSSTPCVLIFPVLTCICLCLPSTQGQAANTANRRVLVTDKNGNQSVQTIKDELGMKVKDVGDIKRRLGSQGVDTNHVEMYGQADNKMDKPTSFRRGHSMAGTVLLHPCARSCCAVLFTSCLALSCLVLNCVHSIK